MRQSLAGRWLLPMLLLCLVGSLAVSLLVWPKPDTVLVVAAPEAPVTQHSLPPRIRPETTTYKLPTAVFVVRRHDGWLALSNQATHPKACDLAWQADSHRFIDPCLGTAYDVTGLNVAGPAPYGLDAYPVKVNEFGQLEIDLSHPVRVGKGQ